MALQPPGDGRKCQEVVGEKGEGRKGMQSGAMGQGTGFGGRGVEGRRGMQEGGGQGRGERGSGEGDGGGVGSSASSWRGWRMHLGGTGWR